MNQPEIEALCQQAEAFRGAGRFADALAACEQALALAPGHASTLSVHAHVLRQLGRPAQAMESAERALQSDPQNATAWFNLASALEALGRPKDAERAFREAITLRPRYAEAWSNLGNLLLAQRRRDEAVAAYREGIGANPTLAPIWSNLGNALCDVKRYAEAIDACRRALAIDPHFATAWTALARGLQESGHIEESIDACRRALDRAPGVAQAWGLLGNGLHELGRDSEAVAACERALVLDPTSVGVLISLGNALQGQHMWQAAMEVYNRALAIDPHVPQLHVAIGRTYWRRGDHEGAIESYQRAMRIDPAHGYAAWNLATSLLALGRLEEGWKHFEARWKRLDAKTLRYAWKCPAKISPRGLDFSGVSRVLLWGEQGIGDEILYVPMAAEIAVSGVDTTLEAEPRLVSLFRRSFENIRVAERTENRLADDRFDCVLPVASLASTLRASFDAFPRRAGYLKPDVARVAQYREALMTTNEVLVGISWRSRAPKIGASKSIPLETWLPILEVPGTRFVSLQHGDTETERAQAARASGKQVATVSELDLFSDIDGLAALVAACDIVVSCSNIVAHVAGALGQPGIVLLPKETGRHWYWFLGRGRSPWYPSLGLVSQETDGNWTSAIDRAAEQLKNFSAGATP